MGPGFESLKLHQWPIGQVVKTAASHAVNIGSNPVWVTKLSQPKGVDIKDVERHPYEVRIDCDEGPPVSIPNTEVKLICADNTWRATAREDR